MDCACTWSEATVIHSQDLPGGLTRKIWRRLSNSARKKSTCPSTPPSCPPTSAPTPSNTSGPPYSPSFRIILKRTNHLGPNYASFIVPLWFSKFDLRDYLYNVYKVTVRPSIRSYVKQTRVRQGKNPDDPRPQPQRWHRPRSIKHMTVELERPFVWPDEMDGEYREKEGKGREMEEQKEQQRLRGPMADRLGVSETQRVAMREQAKALLEGRERWRPVRKMGGVTM